MYNSNNDNNDDNDDDVNNIDNDNDTRSKNHGNYTTVLVVVEAAAATLVVIILHRELFSTRKLTYQRCKTRITHYTNIAVWRTGTTPPLIFTELQSHKFALLLCE